MSADRLNDLRGRLHRLPRFRLARLPTPLDEMPRLSDALRVRVLVKRDDMTGLAFGGNKTRELDFFIGDALAQQADVFIAGGGTGQSNHAVQCAAAALRAGMTPVMVLHRYRADDVQGNLLLDRLMDVDLRFVATTGVDSAIHARTALLDVMEQAAAEYRARGHKPYILPSSFHVLGATGYVDCGCELEAQLRARDVAPDHMYLASAGATQVGLALAAKDLGCRYKVTGINYAAGGADVPARQIKLASEVATLLGIDTALEATDLPNHSFAGPGYGVPTPEGIEAIRLLARTEGMFVDPVYSGKAMAALLAHVRDGRIAKGSTVVFVHTGGLPALFAYNTALVERSQTKD